jgi:HD-GYP domain-containing protein (c-di-GMP phosphodiesterase class II)
MKIILHKQENAFKKPGETTAELYSDESVGVTRIKGIKGTNANITIEDSGIHDELPTKHLLFSIDASLRITVGKDVYYLSPGDSLSIVDPVSYTVYSLKPGQYLLFTTSQIRETYSKKVVDAAKELLDRCDAMSQEHCHQVGLMALAIGNVLMKDQDTSFLHYAAGYLDVGNGTLPSGFLAKKERFNESDRRLVESHAQAGYDLLKPLFGEKIATLVKHHHERLDGSGYPDHLRGNEIDLEERILMVADVFSALTSERPYRPAYSYPEALSILDKDYSGKLDPEVILVLKELLQAGTISRLNS